MSVCGMQTFWSWVVTPGVGHGGRGYDWRQCRVFDLRTESRDWTRSHVGGSSRPLDTQVDTATRPLHRAMRYSGSAEEWMLLKLHRSASTGGRPHVDGGFIAAARDQGCCCEGRWDGTACAVLCDQRDTAGQPCGHGSRGEFDAPPQWPGRRRQWLCFR